VQLSALLNGKIARPPAWELVGQIVVACHTWDGRAGLPPADRTGSCRSAWSRSLAAMSTAPHWSRGTTPRIRQSRWAAQGRLACLSRATPSSGSTGCATARRSRACLATGMPTWLDASAFSWAFLLVAFVANHRWLGEDRDGRPISDDQLRCDLLILLGRTKAARGYRTGSVTRVQGGIRKHTSSGGRDLRQTSTKTCPAGALERSRRNEGADD
jgi:hypothetical protein